VRPAFTAEPIKILSPHTSAPTQKILGAVSIDSRETMKGVELAHRLHLLMALRLVELNIRRLKRLHANALNSIM
jgi:hypothetical protein